MGTLTSNPTLGDTKRTPKNRFIWHACEDCGKERWVCIVRDKPGSRRCHRCALINKNKGWTGENSPCWKGGTIISKKGYVTVFVDKNDFFYPMAFKKNPYVPEHRLVMAKHLGRLLHTWEIVHHINGNKSDNRIENLQITSDLGHKQITLLESKINRLIESQEELKKEIRVLRLQLTHGEVPELCLK
jgi:hypothetical protein